MPRRKTPPVTLPAEGELMAVNDRPGKTSKPYRQMSQAEAIHAFWPEIERRISEGETLSAVCRYRLEDGTRPDGRPCKVKHLREPDTFPSRTVIYDWCEAHPDIARRFARARALCDERWEDEAIEIAEDASRDYVQTDTGALIFDSEHVQRSKLRIWARQQLIDRRKSRRPSERAEVLGQLQTKGGGRLQEPVAVIGVEPLKHPDGRPFDLEDVVGVPAGDEP